MKQKNKKLEKGITLIALIITIIILLILAGVTITMLTGDNGILKQATNARETNTKAELEEQVKLAVMASKVNDTASINIETLEDEINKISGTTITKSADDKLPWTVKKGSYEVTITEDGTITTNTTGKDDGKKDDCKKDDDKKEEDTRTVLEQATAAMPEGSTIDSTTNENTGIVMIDSNGNEWVWIEVPSTVFTNATSSTDYENIKTDLITYASDYREGAYRQGLNWTDEWYAMDGETLVTASTEGLTDEQKLLNNGCGLTYNEYNTNYNKMLSSIYTNKGFYIGRYEAGIEGSDTDTSLSRYSRTEITSDSPKAVSKKDMIPYNFVTCSDAQQLANGMSTGNKTSSLMFGIQWDLVCKFLEVKGNWDTTTNTAQYYIKQNSTSWGNHADSSITLARGKYNILPSSSSSTWKSFNIDTKNYVTSSQTNSSTSYKQLLTTGASENTNKMNIYDFAGNEFEWTLEKATVTQPIYPCGIRGGGYDSNGSYYSAAGYICNSTTHSNDYIGLRPSLY